MSSFTLQDMRKQIADILEQPVEAIEDGVDLIDLGLDSIRMMELATRWSQSLDRYIDFGALAEHAEVRAWWKLVSDEANEAT